MKIVFALVLSVFVVGCSSFQPSTYENRNTPYGNEVVATGRAADNAASANQSMNCPSCTMTGRTQSGNYRSQNGTRQPDYLAGIGNSAVNTAVSEISNEINQAIRDAFK